MITAALLDANGVYLRMDELASKDQLTARHLATVTKCDLPAGEYKWVPDATNPYGGAFWPLTWLARCAADMKAVEDSQLAGARMAERRADRLLEVHTQDQLDAAAAAVVEVP